jgi:hypothetical protein
VTYKKGSGLEDWICCALYIHIVRDYRHYKRYHYCTHFPVHVARALGFLVFISPIPATDLSQSHCNFNSHLKSSWHSLIPFSSFNLNDLRLPSPEFDSILFRLLFCTFSALSPLHSCPAEHFITTSHKPQRRTPFSIIKNARLLVRCLAMDIHVTIFIHNLIIDAV